MRVLFCGSRGFKDVLLVGRVLSWLLRTEGNLVVIHGGARGADTLVDKAARSRRLTVEAFPADWKAHGKAAGPIRNQRMLDEGKPDLIVALYSGDTPTPGTADMMRRAEKAFIPVRRA